MRRLARLVAIVRGQGPRGALRALGSSLRRNAFACEIEALHVFRHSVRAGASTDVALPVNLRFEAVALERPESVAAVAAAWPAEWRVGRTEADIRSLLERDLRAGDECFALWDEARVVAAGWVTRRNGAALPPFAKAYPLGERDALRRTTFVVPAYQGQRLQVTFGLLIREWSAKTHGIERFYAYVGVRNVASVRNAARIYDERCVVYHVRLTILGLCFDMFPKRRHNDWRPCREVSEPGRSSDSPESHMEQD